MSSPPFSPRLSRRMSRAVSADGEAARIDPTAPYRQLLGPTLKALWDARAGIDLVSGDVNGWTDQIGQWTLLPVAGARPTYVPDGAYFKGRPVVGITNATGKRLNITLTPPYIVPLGERPMVFMVTRLPILGAGNRWLLRTTDAAYTQEAAGFYEAAGTALVATFAGENINGNFGDTAPHTFASFFEPVNGTRTCTIDGTTLVTGGAGGALLKEIGRVIVGGDGTSANVQDANIAQIGIVNPAPDASTRAQLLSLLRTDWGMP